MSDACKETIELMATLPREARAFFELGRMVGKQELVSESPNTFGNLVKEGEALVRSMLDALKKRLP